MFDISIVIAMSVDVLLFIGACPYILGRWIF